MATLTKVPSGAVIHFLFSLPNCDDQGLAHLHVGTNRPGLGSVSLGRKDT